MTPRPAPRRGAAKGRPPRQGGRPLTGGQVGGPRRAPARDKEGLGGEQVEGRHAVLELLKARRRPIQRIYVAEAQDPSDILDAIELEAQRQRVPVQVVSMARLDREARTEGHQGCSPSPLGSRPFPWNRSWKRNIPSSWCVTG